MELRSLRHVATLARLRSFTKAAEELGLTQPALSRSIQAVEQAAKVRLFDRDRGGARLTPVGRFFAERASALLRDAEDLERLMERVAGGSEGEVAFGMAPLLAASFGPTVLAEMLRESPDLRIRAAVRGSDALLSLLLSEEIEFCVCAEGQIQPPAPLKSSLLGWFPMTLLVRPEHPLLAPGPHTPDACYPWITARQLGGPDGVPATRDPRLVGAPSIVLEDYGALARITERSDAIWLCSSSAVIDEVRAGRLTALPPAPGLRPQRYRIMTYALERRTLSPGALQLIAKFRAEIRKIEASAPAEAE
jgi:DNA-binding transcriptional LysR family regulator